MRFSSQNRWPRPGIAAAPDLMLQVLRNPPAHSINGCNLGIERKLHRMTVPRHVVRSHLRACLPLQTWLCYPTTSEFTLFASSQCIFFWPSACTVVCTTVTVASTLNASHRCFDCGLLTELRSPADRATLECDIICSRSARKKLFGQGLKCIELIRPPSLSA